MPVTPDLFSDYQYALTAGVDEAGRGPLAGDVVAAAVILPPQHNIRGINDSKKLNEAKREALYDQILLEATAYAVGRCNIEEIDSLNILHASMLAMKRAVEALAVQPEQVLVDGNRLPKWNYLAEAVVGGDAKVECIGAASILAKVTRDREMIALAEQYPDFGFEKHKGYPTALHLAKLEQYGPTPQHRRSFGPVKKLLLK